MTLTKGKYASAEGVWGIGDLLALALELGAQDAGGPLSATERDLAETASRSQVDPSRADAWRARILAGEDPFGFALARTRPIEVRRELGQFFTPPELVEHICEWVTGHSPTRVVDAGSGTGRFAGAFSKWPGVSIVAIDSDPVSTLLTRARLAVLGRPDARVLNGDFLTVALEPIQGRTAFVGNPPYVRHHRLPAELKDWGLFAARHFGLAGSRLAGLHALFFLATALKARPGDLCAFLTSSEWFDSNYGQIIRALFLRELGGVRMDVVPPATAAFDDVMTTATISFCEVGTQGHPVEVRRLESPGGLVRPSGPQLVSRADLSSSRNWTRLLELGSLDDDPHKVQMGRYFRAHRGVVTGSNKFFVLTRSQAKALGLTEWCRPAITSAREILESDGVVRDAPERRLLLDVPPDVNRSEHPSLDAYLRSGELPADGQPPVSSGYITSHRRPWWAVGHKASPPIVVTYMARKPPAFATNPDGLALINVAHGMYPFRSMPSAVFERLVRALNSRRADLNGFGRTYQGGLQKLEPREVERLPIPEELVEELRSAA